MTIWTQSVTTSVAQRYWRGGVDPKQLRAEYGDLASEEGVGANMRVELSVSMSDASQDQEQQATQEEQALLALSLALKNLKARLDHKALFLDWDEFKDNPSTLEAIAFILAKHLHSYKLPRAQPVIPLKWHKLKLWETDQLGVEVDLASSLNRLATLIWRFRNLEIRFLGEMDNENFLILPRGRLDELGQNLSKGWPGSELSQTSEWLSALKNYIRQEFSNISGVQVDKVTVDLGSQEHMSRG